ncbi:MAG TPA: hypothetical protein PLL76_20845, partial [Thermoanaerobaculia bacterium]|nr:hypothetical protein [Thermoanaerobaculia bacterium]
MDVDKLTREMPRLAAVKELAERHRFLHWELEFAEVFADRGGFDLIVGNPPWIKVEWNEGGVMGDFEPLFVLKGHSATRYAELRREAMGGLQGLREAYLDEFADFAGMQGFLNAEQNYPLLKKSQTNLYKCFLPQAWMAQNERGAGGFIHQEGVYDDPKGGAFRAALYPRLRYHFHFQNELLLFPEIDHHRPYSVNVTGVPRNDVSFVHMANLFAPSTIDASLEAEPRSLAEQARIAGAVNGAESPVPGIKDDDGRWCVEGHPSRAIHVDIEQLRLFAQLYDEPDTPPREARLPALHARELVAVLEKLAAAPKRLGDLGDDVFPTEMWHETNSQNDGTICRETRFPAGPAELIYQGPHIYVANPLYKTPRAICDTNLAHDPLDLTVVPADYLPRTNYLRACDDETYRARTPTTSWLPGQPVDRFFRLAFRKMLSQAGERTLTAAVIPPMAGHIDGCFSLTFRSIPALLAAAAVSASVVADFLSKSTGKANFRDEIARQLPDLTESALYPRLAVRVLLLNCLTSHYSDLWSSAWEPHLAADVWTTKDARLAEGRFTALTQDWTWSTPLRSDLERR